MIVNMHEAKTHLSKYVEKALLGEEIILARNGEPAVMLVPVASMQGKKRNNLIFGIAKRNAKARPRSIDDFSLSEEEIDCWYNSELFPPEVKCES